MVDDLHGHLELESNVAHPLSLHLCSALEALRSNQSSFLKGLASEIEQL
jgi:hypothetical protein